MLEGRWEQRWSATTPFLSLLSHSLPLAPPLANPGHFESDQSHSYNVTSVDIVEWLVANVKPTDNLFVRMDIEGAEYEVMRYLINHGIACWFNTLQLEFHALHHRSNYNKVCASEGSAGSRTQHPSAITWTASPPSCTPPPQPLTAPR